eukprot:scaffold5238_cov140-Skeletonema_dohrnii-CCMP3373.AAC.5
MDDRQADPSEGIIRSVGIHSKRRSKLQLLQCSSFRKNRLLSMYIPRSWLHLEETLIFRVIAI